MILNLQHPKRTASTASQENNLLSRCCIQNVLLALPDCISRAHDIEIRPLSIRRLIVAESFETSEFSSQLSLQNQI